RQAGLPAEAMARDAVSQFDVDTPTDLFALALHPNTGPTTRRELEALELPTATHRAAMTRFTEATSQVIVAGRVSSAVWAHLERDTACRVRVFSEERGMKADGREGAGLIRSLLGLFIDVVGPNAAFAVLAELGDAAYVDSRVLFAHARLALTTEDRFQSDLGAWQSVTNPVARAITRAAVDAPIPVVMGGHSLMSGGLYVICDAAWREHDRLRGAPGP
ncbi:MAG: hypothetical protein NZ518_05820, partial [Dehalococcoidia bacterium]|nr:hypothetical protein [Dehalococcoidia bacterium]